MTLSPVMTSNTALAETDPDRTGIGGQPRDLAQAAEQFEALLIQQLLQMAHGEEGGWLGSGEDSAGGPATSMAEQGLSLGIAQSGGLGLAQVITRQLAPPAFLASSPATTPQAAPTRTR